MTDPDGADADTRDLEREREIMNDRATFPTLEDVPRRDLALIITEDPPAEALEAFVQQLDLYRLPPSVVRLREIAKAANDLADAMEFRWANETGGLGWRDGSEGPIWTFRGSSSRKWGDIPGLVDALLKEGLQLRTITGAISELRVTDLRAAAALRTPETAKRIVALIEEFRGPHHGPPHFRKLEED